MGSQILIKSPFKLKRDTLKAAKKNNWDIKNGPHSNVERLGYWSNEYHYAGPVELHYQIRKLVSFYECAVQRVHDENPDSERFVLNEDLNEPLGYSIYTNDISSYVGHSSIHFGIYLHTIFHSVFTFTVQSPQNLWSNPYNRKSENGS